MSYDWPPSHDNGLDKLTLEEKTQTLTMLEQGMSPIHVTTDLKVTRIAIYTLLKAAVAALLGTLSQCKEGSIFL